MNKPLNPQIEAVEQSPSPHQNSTLIPQTPKDSADIDWEIEIIARRHSDGDKGTKSDGSQGCH